MAADAAETGEPAALGDRRAAEGAEETDETGETEATEETAEAEVAGEGDSERAWVMRGQLFRAEGVMDVVRAGRAGGRRADVRGGRQASAQ
ncbi:hypothetical protein GCM10023324_57540 [Streptomyces youssoufiensis]